MVEHAAPANLETRNTVENNNGFHMDALNSYSHPIFLSVGSCIVLGTCLHTL